MEIGPEVIRRIEEEVKRALANPEPRSATASSDKPILAIFDAAQVDLSLVSQQLGKCVAHGYTITAVLSELAAKLLDVSHIRSVLGDKQALISSEITNLQPFIEDFPTIVLPNLSYPMAAKLAVGMADTPCTYLVFQAMLRQKRVIASSDALEGSASVLPPPEISRLGENYLKTLSNFGIQFIPAQRLAETILSVEPLRLSPVDARRGKNVISASVIANLGPNVREFVYSNPAIITPLARDLAAQKGVQLVARQNNL